MLRQCVGHWRVGGVFPTSRSSARASPSLAPARSRRLPRQAVAPRPGRPAPLPTAPGAESPSRPIGGKKRGPGPPCHTEGWGRRLPIAAASIRSEPSRGNWSIGQSPRIFERGRGHSCLGATRGTPRPRASRPRPYRAYGVTGAPLSRVRNTKAPMVRRFASRAAQAGPERTAFGRRSAISYSTGADTRP